MTRNRSKIFSTFKIRTLLITGLEKEICREKNMHPVINSVTANAFRRDLTSCFPNSASYFLNYKCIIAD